jgi:hypothetical protein
MNRTLEAVAMLERCLRLDRSYSPAYLVLAKLRSPPIAARLLYHVTQLLPHSPDYQAYFATWLHERGTVALFQGNLLFCFHNNKITQSPFYTDFNLVQFYFLSVQRK